MTKVPDKITELFNLLDKWRYFPAYQLERRADIFFVLYLKQIFDSKYDVLIDYIIPEFPLRIGEIIDKEVNESFKIDYLCVSQVHQKVYLVELKTDTLSRRSKQDWYLGKAREINTAGLVNGLIKIYQATNQKHKYMNLLREVEQIGWVKIDQPQIINTCKPYDIQILYIQPEKHPDDTVEVITFDDIISIIKTNPDDVSSRFIQSLERWKINPSLLRSED
jgi:hypothetical protein